MTSKVSSKLLAKRANTLMRNAHKQALAAKTKYVVNLSPRLWFVSVDDGKVETAVNTKTATKYPEFSDAVVVRNDPTVKQEYPKQVIQVIYG